MQEFMYSGNLTILPCWLIYPDLEKNDADIFTYNDSIDLAIKIKYCVDNLMELQKQALCMNEFIYKVSSWEYCINNWIRILND